MIDRRPSSSTSAHVFFHSIHGHIYSKHFLGDLGALWKTGTSGNQQPDMACWHLAPSFYNDVPCLGIAGRSSPHRVETQAAYYDLMEEFITAVVHRYGQNALIKFEDIVYIDTVFWSSTKTNSRFLTLLGKLVVPRGLFVYHTVSPHYEASCPCLQRN